MVNVERMFGCSNCGEILHMLKTLVDRLGSGPRLVDRSGVRVSASFQIFVFFPHFTRSNTADPHYTPCP